MKPSSWMWLPNWMLTGLCFLWWEGHIAAWVQHSIGVSGLRKVSKPTSSKSLWKDNGGVCDFSFFPWFSLSAKKTKDKRSKHDTKPRKAFIFQILLAQSFVFMTFTWERVCWRFPANVLYFRYSENILFNLEIIVKISKFSLHRGCTETA